MNPGTIKKTKNPSSLRKNTNPSPLERVRDAVLKFFESVPDVVKVTITRVAQVDKELKLWEAEAEVFVPNATILLLQLPVENVILDLKHYLLKLDENFDIVAYEIKDGPEE